ncbi:MULTISPECIES: hypothetical protein [Clostridium]|uniref:hypothetical protein n=1 Tax=Clostridium TaxID=1485 RepID=UPI0006A6FAC9|nr:MULTISPECIES: hypothetical protein [Clostridium]
MSNEHISINKMWKNSLNLIGENELTTKLECNSWRLGDNEALANELVTLVLNGNETATTSLCYLY